MMIVSPLSRGAALAVFCTLMVGCEFGTIDIGTGSPFFDAAADSIPPSSLPPADPLLDLGQLLFFDRELSGNRNIACATCHFPFSTTTENLVLSIGEGGTGLGPTRSKAEGVILPRNTTALFARPDAPALFWDGRVEVLADGSISAPIPLPEGLTSAEEALAFLPLFDRSEMRGQAGDVDIFGQPNELALIDDSEGFAEALVARLLVFNRYEVLFAQAFPGEEPSFQHIARALTHFRQELWGHADTDWDQREETPVSLAAELGAELFFGDAGCARCHNGADFGGDAFVNIGVPQLGPGFATMMPDGTTDLRPGLDEGRFNTTDDPSDRFAFRVPPLRNVRLSGPWMHNGAYATLEAAVRHHLDPEASLAAYDDTQLPTSLRATVQNDGATQALLLETLSDEVAPLRPLTETDIALLLEFLAALESERERTSAPGAGIPFRVPSGLDLDSWPGGPHPFR